MKYKYNGKNKLRAQKLRREMTPEEKHLWHDCLKQMPVRFIRQKMIGNYIVDFYCHSASMVIELDGSQHFDEKGEEYDKQRDEYLKSLGLTVVRYPNNAIRNDFISVCEDIYNRLGLL